MVTVVCVCVGGGPWLTVSVALTANPVDVGPEDDKHTCSKSMMRRGEQQQQGTMKRRREGEAAMIPPLLTAGMPD